MKELKELAAVLQTLAGLEKVLEPMQAAGKRQIVQCGWCCPRKRRS